MNPNSTKPASEPTPAERAWRMEEATIVREREAIRKSYLTIRAEELARLERIIEGQDAK